MPGAGTGIAPREFDGEPQQHDCGARKRCLAAAVRHDPRSNVCSGVITRRVAGGLVSPSEIVG